MSAVATVSDADDGVGIDMLEQGVRQRFRIFQAEPAREEERRLGPPLRMSRVEEVVDDLLMGDEHVPERNARTDQKAGSVVTRKCSGSTVTSAAKGLVNSTS